MKIPKKISNTFRWLSFLPIAIIVFVIAGIIFNIFFSISNWYAGVEIDSGWSKISYYIMSSAVSSILAVYYGAKVAPSSKNIVALFLGGFMLVMATIHVVIAFLGHQLDFFWVVMSSISTALGAGYIVYKFFTEGDDFDLFHK